MPIGKPEAPPAKTPRGSSTKSVTPASQGRMQRRSDALQGYFGLASLGALTKGWYADSQAISMHGERVSDEVAKLAEDNEQMASWLDLMSKTGPYMGLAMAIMPMILQILANHNRIPVEAGMSLGVMPPAALEAKAKQEIAAVAAEAVKLQRKAEQDLAKAQAELSAQPMNGQPSGVPSAV